ncbi:MAG: hypothetical protein ACTSQJ_16660 [Promethearchaeota archaeon]
MSSQLQEYAKKILESFNKKIIEYFESFKSEKNILYKDYLDGVIVHPHQEREFDVGIPLEKGRKVDFAMESLKYKMPALATIRFKNFPLEEVMVRIEFPNILFGPKDLQPKILFSTTLRTPWPGDFGLIWLPLTGSDKFAFHPYENKDKKVEDLLNFYQESIVDPLCDFLNTSKHRLAVRLRNNLKNFIESEDSEIWNYKNQFKKKEYNIIEVPIYCEYFEDNDASILYFECYSLKKRWIPPADIIVNILQYIGLSTEMFDYDGNLISEEDMKIIDAQLDRFDETAKKVEKKKKAIKLKEEWDPFKPIKTVKRDEFGYAVGASSGISMAKESQSVLDNVQRMKNLMQQNLQKSTEMAMPPSQQPTISPIQAKPSIPFSKQESSELISSPKAPVKTSEPSVALPEKSISTPIQPRLRGGRPIEKQPTIQKTSTFITDKPRLRGQRPGALSQTTSVSPKPTQETIKVDKPIASSEFEFDDEPVSKPSTSITSNITQPSVPTFANASDWFKEFQMRQFVTIGNGQDLPFRDRGNFRIISALPKPFMLTFARDQLRVKKGTTSSEVIEILFNLFKSGHLSPL